MANFGFSSRKVDVSRFSMTPRPDVPRSVFASQHTHKTTFDAAGLVPIYVDEILPGDSVRISMTAFVRMSTPLFPVMDNLHFDCFFFFVPARLVWENWVRFMGEQDEPGASTDYLVPQIDVPIGHGGWPRGSIGDYMGIPTSEQATGGFRHSALPFRAYNLIWNEWFRDQNLQEPVIVNRDNGPDQLEEYGILRRGKRHDYFTSALPWPQKGEAVTLPMADRAPVSGIGVSMFGGTDGGGNPVPNAMGNAWSYTTQGAEQFQNYAAHGAPTGQMIMLDMSNNINALPEVYADLSEATAATINNIRTAFQIQKLLERDARGGTRYTEVLQAHFGVSNPDSRLQRPEYLGGSSTPINITPVAQTSATGIDGGNSPLGALGAAGISVPRASASQSFTEHGYVIGLANVRSDITYQQGLHRMWSRRTRYDYYWPAFAHLGEQAILRQELYMNGINEENGLVFGYQERWAEYRHKPSRISGYFRSATAGTLDSWHLGQHFANAPVLGAEFIQDDPPVERVLAAGELAEDQQFLMDALFNVRHTRAMPTHSVPGFIDRF